MANGRKYKHMKNFTLKKQKLMLALIAVFFTVNMATAQTGLLSYEFETDGDAEGWYINNYNTGATAEVSGGSINVAYDLTQGEYNRANLIMDDLEVNPASYPILAIKWVNAPVRTFQLHCNIGTYNNDSDGSNHDGVLNDNVYYYDLTNNFNSGNYLSLTESTTLDYLQWKVTENISEGTTGYQIEWIRTYASLSALEAALSATPISKGEAENQCTIYSGNSKILVSGCECNAKIELFDISGKLVSTTIAASEEEAIACEKGIFIVKVSGSSVFTGKAVVY